MNNIFEASIHFRSMIRERSAAMVEDWEFLMWLNQALKDMARRALCYEKEAIVRVEDEIRKYEWKFVLPDFLGKVRKAWHRDYPLTLIQDPDKLLWYQSFFTSTASQVLAFYYDSQHFGLRGIPTVKEYSTGTALFTVGSRTVTGTGTSWLTGTNAPAANWGIGTGAEPGKFYPIRSVNSETEIELQEPYLEATTTSTSYLATNGAVRLLYPATPPVVRTISYTSGLVGVVTVTNGSRTVTSSGAPALLTNAARGMHFGVGTATGTTKPSKWYIIRKVVSNTEIELAQPYGEATNAGAANGLITDDSPFEPAFLEVAIDYAISRALKKYGHADADQYMEKYIAGVQMVAGEIDKRYQRHAPPPRMYDAYWGIEGVING